MINKYAVKFRKAAEQDLENIADYLSSKFGKTKMEQGIRGLLTAILDLGIFPKKGRAAVHLHSELLAYYYLPLEKNTILYKINDEQKQIEILRIFSNKGDIVRKLLHYSDQS